MKKEVLDAKDFKKLHDGVWSYRFSHDSIHQLEIVAKFDEKGDIQIKLYNNENKPIGEVNTTNKTNSKKSLSPVEKWIKEINALYQMTF